MRLKIEERGIITVEFPLTQPKRSWKIRTDGKRSADKILGHQIQEHDFLEWMVDYQELRDILYCLKKASLIDFENIVQHFNRLQPTVEKPEKASSREPIKVGNIIVERQFLGKQWKPTELFPYIFVLFRLYYKTISKETNIFLIDKKGEKIINTSDRKIKCGDTLIWLPSKQEISKIIEEFAVLSKKHKETAKKIIFDKIENLNS